MNSAPVLGSEPPAQRGSGSRFQLFAGVLVGLLTAAAISAVHSATQSKTRSRTVPAGPASVALTSPEMGSAPASANPVALEDQRRREMQAHRAAIEQHLREPRDPLWAPGSEKSLRALLEPVATRAKYRIASIDCRSTSCIAELSFASYAVAQENWRAVLHAQNLIGCGVAIAVEEPPIPAKNYALSVVYDCAETRRSALGANH